MRDSEAGRSRLGAEGWALVGGGGVTFAVVLWTIYRPWDLENAFMIGAPVGRDFANFWIGGRLALEGHLGLLVDLKGYNELLYRTFGHNPEEWLVFSYPPHMLLALVPFGLLPFVPAVWLWSALNLLCIGLAARLVGAGRRLAVIACLSPAGLLALAHGHFGGALGLLATCILARAERRPLLAGACLALMTVKPHLAAILGLFLVCTGRWRAALAAIPATLGLLAFSVLAFGVQPWVDFVRWTVPFHAAMLSEFAIDAHRTTMSLYAAARTIGVTAGPAQALQYAFALVVLGRAVLLFRRHGPDARTIALALLAGIVALPYCQPYDLAIAAPALTVALFAPTPARRPFLPLVPAASLWIGPAFSVPFGLLAFPLVPVLVAAAVFWALFAPANDRAEASAVPPCAPVA